MIWWAVIGGSAVGAAVFVVNPSYSVEGSGDAAQVAATLLVAVALEVRVLSTAVAFSGRDLPLRVAASLSILLVGSGTSVATVAAMQGQALERVTGAVVQAAVMDLLLLVLLMAYFGAYLSDD